MQGGAMILAEAMQQKPAAACIGLEYTLSLLPTRCRYREHKQNPAPAQCTGCTKAPLYTQLSVAAMQFHHSSMQSAASEGRQQWQGSLVHTRAMDWAFPKMVPVSRHRSCLTRYDWLQQGACVLL